MSNLKRVAIKGLPDSALMECAFLTGKRKSGKSVTQRLAMERALTLGIRCGWIDGVGVGWGVTVAADGKGPGFEVVVFGGEHGHLPISETSGGALGTTLAKAEFSWVLDLSKLPSKASRVRFMLDFVQALYENCEETLLLFMDEVDLWAPQNIMDKQGPSANLLGAMHELVRRGRIKGLNIWMATQRPAEVSKGIISQAECMLTFKLVAPQDLNAATDWMQAHVAGDKTKINFWKSEIPSLSIGQAMVYLTEPTVSIETVQFPAMITLDTFRPPKRGETAHSGKGMAKVDLSKIRETLGAVETELKANDPAALKAQIADLTKKHQRVVAELMAQIKAKGAPAGATKVEVDQAYKGGYETGYQNGHNMGTSEANLRLAANAKAFDAVKAALGKAVGAIPEESGPLFARFGQDERPSLRAVSRCPSPSGRGPGKGAVDVPEGLSGRHMRILNAVAWWKAAGIEQPSRAQVAGAARYAPNNGNFNNLVGALKTAGLIDYPTPGTLMLTSDGEMTAELQDVPTQDELHSRVRGIISPRHIRIFDAALGAYPESMSREDLGSASGYQAGNGNFNNLVGALKTLGFLEYPNKGSVRAAKWLFL